MDISRGVEKCPIPVENAVDLVDVSDFVVRTLPLPWSFGLVFDNQSINQYFYFIAISEFHSNTHNIGHHRFLGTDKTDYYSIGLEYYRD